MHRAPPPGATAALRRESAAPWDGEGSAADSRASTGRPPFRIPAGPRRLGFKIGSGICGVGGCEAVGQDADVAAVWLFVLCAVLAMIAYLTGPLYSRAANAGR
jgi:hypothetical protein